MQMKTLLFSDLHIGHDASVDLRPYEWVRQAIGAYSPNLVVFMGDIGDFWRAGPALRNDLIAAVKQVVAWAPRAVYILGNHDHFVSTLPPGTLGCDVVPYYDLQVGRRQWFVVHGDESDFLLWGTAFGLTQEDIERLYLWVCDHPEVAAGWDAGEAGGTIAIVAKAAVQMGLFHDWQPNLVSLLQGVATCPWDFHPTVPHVRSRVAEYYKRRACDLIFGHYHDPRYQAWKLWLIASYQAADCGSFLQKSFLVLDDTEALLLRRWNE
jgi:UDP-2,3-diacylglucosamine pyrophosphatase LpxH